MITPQFLQSCQSGDEESVEILVRSHQRAVFQLALSVIDDGPTTAGGASGVSPEALFEAETATRETFIAALDRLNHYREDTPFEPWLYRIAVQVSRRRYRLWKLRRRLDKLLGSARFAVNRRLNRGAPRSQGKNPPLVKSAPGVDPRFQPGDADLWAAVRALPEKLRLAVVLRYYHDMSIADIARVLGTREGAVHARLDAARERIARERGVPESAG